MTAINSNRAIRGPVTAVPVVAGKGVRLVADTENNRWVVEADETVLWEGDTQPIRTTSIPIDLSETALNFEYIRFEGLSSYAGDNGEQLKFVNTTVANSEMCFGNNLTIANGLIIVEAAYATVSGSSLTLIGAGRANSNSSGQISVRTDRGPTLYKVVGINRITSA